MWEAEVSTNCSLNGVAAAANKALVLIKTREGER